MFSDITLHLITAARNDLKNCIQIMVQNVHVYDISQ